KPATIEFFALASFSWNGTSGPRLKDYPPNFNGTSPSRAALFAWELRGEFRTRLHHAQDGIPRDHAHDLVRAVAGSAHHRPLIDIGAQQPLEQFQKRLVRRGPQNLIPRDHRGLDRIVSPLRAR